MVRNLLCRWREDVVNDGNLCRVNGHLADVAQCAGQLALDPQGIEVPEVHEDGFHWMLATGRTRVHQHLSPRVHEARTFRGPLDA